METIVDKLLSEVDKVGQRILKDSGRWNQGQKIVAFLVCLLAGAALVSGASHVRVAAGVTIALFGIAFLTFTRRTIESETLVLKDGKGKPRIALSGENGLYFFDDNKQVRMLATLYEGHPAIALNGADGKPKLFVRLTHEGSNVSIGEPANIAAEASDDGKLGLVFTNEDGEPTMVLGSRGLNGHLSFFGDKRVLLASYPDEEAVRRYASSLADGTPMPTLPQTKAS